MVRSEQLSPLVRQFALQKGGSTVGVCRHPSRSQSEPDPSVVTFPQAASGTDVRVRPATHKVRLTCVYILGENFSPSWLRRRVIDVSKLACSLFQRQFRPSSIPQTNFVITELSLSTSSSSSSAFSTRMGRLLKRSTTTATTTSQNKRPKLNGGSGSSSRGEKDTQGRQDVAGSRYRIVVKSIACTHSGCGSKFKDRDLLHVHLKQQHRLLPYRCLVAECEERFSSK